MGCKKLQFLFKYESNVLPNISRSGEHHYMYQKPTYTVLLTDDAAKFSF